MQNTGTIRTYIQCLASICRQAGYRLCSHINRAMMLLMKYSRCDDDELREFCLQACEAFVLRCPTAIVPHISMVRFKFGQITILFSIIRTPTTRSLNCVLTT